ncbi:hypothetical protein GH714_031061 [Hevea brasiliensis]|uniref:PGG domain-containing protein n=1 Tax=Hevea brasiliensis TaxID=3981 RepID=A0A6A6NK41_HEVBR|nr:hypothetical protein GH714_031061 [Hevea brasiliensis]
MERQLSFIGGGDRKKSKESPGKRGDSQIHLAARAGNLSRVREILQNCDGNDAKDGFDPFHIAAKQGHLEVLKELLHGFPNLVMTTDLSCTTALHTAATQGYVDVVNLLLETDSNLVKIARNNGKTALHSAARMGHLEVVRSLLGKDPSTGLRTDKKGQTALHMAVKGQNEEIVLELLKPDPSVMSLEDNKGNTALHIATKKGRTQNVRCLLSVEGITVNATNKAGETPLDIAEKLDIPEIVSILKGAGAVNSKDLGKPPNPAKQLKQTVSDIKHDVESQLQQTRQTAIFTVPGQYVEDKEKGTSLGQAHIAKNPAFLVFFVFDSLALFISLAVVVVQTSVVVIEQKAKKQLVFVINKLMWLACLFISISFVSLTYVVVGQKSRWLAIYATVIGGSIMLTTIGSMCYCVILHRMEESRFRSIRRESRSRSYSMSMVSEQEILDSEYKRMYAL